MAPHLTALSQMTENRKVEDREPLIFQHFPDFASKKQLCDRAVSPTYLGTMGSVIWEGYCALCRMVCNAGLSSASSAIRRPVLGFRSKRGKLLLEISTLIRCPALKTLLVAHRSIV